MPAKGNTKKQRVASSRVASADVLTKSRITSLTVGAATIAVFACRSSQPSGCQHMMTDHWPTRNETTGMSHPHHMGSQFWTGPDQVVAMIVVATAIAMWHLCRHSNQHGYRRACMSFFTLPRPKHAPHRACTQPSQPAAPKTRRARILRSRRAHGHRSRTTKVWVHLRNNMPPQSRRPLEAAPRADIPSRIADMIL